MSEAWRNAPWLVVVVYEVAQAEDTAEAITAAVLSQDDPSTVMVLPPHAPAPRLSGGFYRTTSWREANRACPPSALDTPFSGVLDPAANPG